MASINHVMYPDIVDMLFATAHSPALCVMRATCRAWKKRADALLVRHIFVCAPTSGQDEIQILARDAHSPNGSAFRVPTLCPPLTPSPNANPVFAKHIRIVDFSKEIKAEYVPKWIFRLRKVEVVRDDLNFVTSPAGKDDQANTNDPSDLPNPTHIPPCDVYVTSGPLPFFTDKCAFPLLPGGRIVVSFDDPSAALLLDHIILIDSMLRCTHWLPRFADWGGEIVILFKPPAGCGDADREPYNGTNETVAGIACDIALGLSALARDAAPQCPRFTFVNMSSWSGNQHSPDGGLRDWVKLFLEGIANVRGVHEGAQKSFATNIGFEKLDEHRKRIGPSRFDYEMGTWNEEKCEWVTA